MKGAKKSRRFKGLRAEEFSARPLHLEQYARDLKETYSGMRQNFAQLRKHIAAMEKDVELSKEDLAQRVKRMCQQGKARFTNH
jgi:predicted  nucleic acid-binding Zn-ribbon protein